MDVTYSSIADPQVSSESVGFIAETGKRDARALMDGRSAFFYLAFCTSFATFWFVVNYFALKGIMVVFVIISAVLAKVERDRGSYLAD